MTETVKLHNTNKTMSLEVKAADGTSIHLMPNTKEDVDKKFAWNLPDGVVEFRPKRTVFGTKGTKEIVSKKVVEESSAPVTTPRTTVKTV